MKKRFIIVSLVLLLIGVAIGYWGYSYVKMPYKGNTVRINIPHGSSKEYITKVLSDSLGDAYASHVSTIWQKRGGSPAKAVGSYLISPGETALAFANRLRSGAQNPVKVTLDAPRTFEELAQNLSGQLDFTADEFMDACDSILPERGFTPATYMAAILPDTYEFYWTVTPSKALERLLSYHDEFWNDKRQAKANALGLTPIEVATIASIVEEETAKADERPIVARLYLNRLQRGMRLQADPTVKYAVGDPTLRRILHKHLETVSPYNTYLVDGLPPGPIRIPEKSTLDAVLNAPPHSYLYMCAKEDFSGYHNFARDLSTHNSNARRYQAALNKMNIR